MKSKKYMFTATSLALLSLVSSCAVNPKIDYPFGDGYTPNLDSTPDYHAVDDGFKVDGVLNEVEYRSVRHFIGYKRVGEERAVVDVAVYFGYEGIFIGIDVTENTILYTNPNRPTFINSGIEMYFIKSSSSTYQTPYTLEIDMVADGTLSIKRNIGYSSYGDCAAEDNITPYLATQQKQLDENYGYIHELFISYDYLRKLGFSAAGADVESFYADFVHIAAKNYEGANSAIDRSYYSFAANQLDSGAAWNNPRKTYRFNFGQGLVAYDLMFDIDGPGQIEEEFGYEYAVPKNSCKLIITPDSGDISSLTSLKVNDKDRLSLVKSTNVQGVYSLTITADEITKDLEISASFA